MLLPWYRLLALNATGPSAEQTLRLGGQYFLAQWGGLVLGAVVLVLSSRFVPPRALEVLRRAGSRWLVRPSVGLVALALGTVAATIALVISLVGLEGRPVLMDGMAQLVQARYFAAGRLSAPPLEDAAFWQLQFMVATEGGWASQYPPGFAVLLAAGRAAGVAWLVGPLLLGATVALVTLVAERLLPHDRAAARLGALLVAVSYFLAFHAATYMNHAAAAAFVALALLASLRAGDGSWAWAFLSGAALGALFATRPYMAVVLGPLASVGIWAWGGGSALSRRGWMLRVAGAAAGAAPFVAALGVYNALVFGHPARFGYAAAAGPSHGVGFHTDPWGSPYGPVEALGATSADLLGLGLDLLQTPISIVVIVAVWLALVKWPGRGGWLILGWATLPLVAHALYWHHDLYMGPRLLYESAPAWCILVASATLGFIRMLPQGVPGGGRRPLITGTGVAATAILFLAVGLTVAGPAKLAGYAAVADAAGLTVAPPRVEGPALAFVHEDWESRLGARLSALGMRLDSIRGALRHNTTCEVERFVTAWEARPESSPAADPQLAFEPRGERDLRLVRMPSGAAVRTYPGERLGAACEREAASDFAGVVALAPLLWQGDLPGLDGSGAMFVRDLGPERNARLIARHPAREPKVLLRTGGGPPRLVAYEGAMRALWSMPEGAQEPPEGGVP